MENKCIYEQISVSEDHEDFSWKTFARQLRVCSVIWVCFFMYGMCLGGPTVIIPQIRREANSTDIISDEMASWLSAIYGYGGIPWVIILPIAAKICGRKLPFVFICITAAAAFTVFYTSSSVIQIFIGEVLESIVGAALTTVAILVMTEYTSPKYRGFFLTIKSATLFWGIWAANAIGTFSHWKVIGLTKLLISIYPLIVVLFWPESPYWLASKGKFNKCAEIHRHLKGTSASSEKELKSLINSINNEGRVTHEVFSIKEVIDGFKIIFKKEFYKPTILSLLVFALYGFSGKMPCAFYSLDIINKLSSNETAAYRGMLILDGITVLSMYIGCGLTKMLRRRTLLLVSSSIGISSLVVLSLYVYLIKFKIIIENEYLSISLLIIYSFGISCGPMIMSTSIYGELLPLSYRTTSVCIIALSDKLILGTVLKLTPIVIKKIGLEAAFLFFGITSAIFLYLIYLYLPETKDKTLHEIAEMMKSNASKLVKDLKPNVSKVETNLLPDT